MSANQKSSEVILCTTCHQEPPMYPCEDSNDDCNILCADCYWDEDARIKSERRLHYSRHPELLEAFRKHVAETLALPYSPLTKNQIKSGNIKSE